MQFCSVRIMVETVHNIKLENRKALKSLQNVAGVYGLVVPCEEVQFPGVLVGYLTGGEPLRAILPKLLRGKQNESSSVATEEGNEVVTGYGLQLTHDVPQGKFNGTLVVRVCWHDIVYVSQVNFGKKELAY
jgi:hypothetical protein